MARAEETQVHSVTTARKSLAQDRAERTRRYLISMGIRTVCFLLIVVVPELWQKLLCGLAAAVLPFFAVVLGNAVDHRAVETLTPAEPTDAQPLELGSGPVIEALPGDVVETDRRRTS